MNKVGRWGGSVGGGGVDGGDTKIERDTERDRKKVCCKVDLQLE
jgi:hypothetical protein